MTRRLRTTVTLFLATALLAACGEAGNPELGYADDPSIFGAAAKADGLVVEEGSAEALGVLRVANELSLEVLDDVVKLDARAARNIVATREAKGDFLTVQALDDVSYVGLTAFKLMREYAQAQGWIGDEPTPTDPPGELVHGVAMGSYQAYAILELANTATKVELDDDVALDSRAASGIVDARPFADLKALDGASYVGARAFGRLLDFVRVNDLIPACGDGAVQAGPETCDDGNLVDGDGCSATCRLEDDGGLDLPVVHGVLEGSPEAEAILQVANVGSLSILDDAVALDARAARNIVDARAANGLFADLATLDAVPYVGARAFGQLLSYAEAGGDLPTCGNGLLDEGETCDDGNLLDDDGCDALCAVEGPAVDAVIFAGEEQCSGEPWNTRYTYSVISNPPRANTDARIELRFNSRSPYSPTAQQLQLETAPNEWTNVFTTAPAVPDFQTQTFTVSAATLNAAIDAMGWLRFRVAPGTFYVACSQLSVTYNCPECVACPEGQEDVGFGCQDVGAPYDQTLLDHGSGMCSRSSATLTFLAAPEAAADGRLTLQFLPCDGGRISLSMNTRNAGWVDLGTASTGLSCGYANAGFDVPEAYLDAARNEAGEIEVRYNISDSCRPGMGCANANDPCVRRVNLTYEQ